ncbi:MAG TPA: zf-HC2 domain-containing protein [Terriglobia bacterium]|nr:zf-HC2 domain-containing protein [Terriglobia bacterium]
MSVLRFDSRQCEKTRRQLDAYLSNELLVETTGEVSKHLESCEACSRDLESRMRVRNALRRAVAAQLPPESFREALHRRLKRAQPGLWGSAHVPMWTMALAALALVVLAGVAGQQWMRFERGRQMVSGVLALGASDHLHCAIKGHNYSEIANPPQRLREKLGPQYAGVLDVVEKKLPGFQVLEAHICSVPGSPRKYVHFIARGRRTILSVIFTRRDGESLPAGRFLVAGASGGVDLYKAQVEGFTVAGFETNEYFGFVVSDLGQKEVLEIATALGPTLRNALESSVGQSLEPAGPRCSLSVALLRPARQDASE